MTFNLAALSDVFCSLIDKMFSYPTDTILNRLIKICLIPFMICFGVFVVLVVAFGFILKIVWFFVFSLPYYIIYGSYCHSNMKEYLVIDAYDK
jgi:hypothetical protein